MGLDNLSRIFGATLFRSPLGATDTAGLTHLQRQADLVSSIIVLRQLIFKGRPKHYRDEEALIPIKQKKKKSSKKEGEEESDASSKKHNAHKLAKAASSVYHFDSAESTEQIAVPTVNSSEARSMRKDSLKYLALDEVPAESSTDTSKKSKKKKKSTASTTHKHEEDKSSETSSTATEALPSLTRKKTEVIDDIPTATATPVLPSDTSSTSTHHKSHKNSKNHESQYQQLTRKRSSTIGQKEISDSKVHESHFELGDIFTKHQRRLSRSFVKLRNSLSFASLSHIMKSESASQKSARALKHDGAAILNDLQRIVSLSTTSVPHHRRNRSEIHHRDAAVPMISKPLPRPQTLRRKRSFSVNGVSTVTETMK